MGGGQAQSRAGSEGRSGRRQCTSCLPTYLPGPPTPHCWLTSGAAGGGGAPQAGVVVLERGIHRQRDHSGRSAQRGHQALLAGGQRGKRGGAGDLSAARLGGLAGQEGAVALRGGGGEHVRAAVRGAVAIACRGQGAGEVG